MKRFPSLSSFSVFSLLPITIAVLFSASLLLIPSQQATAHGDGETFPIPDEASTANELYDFLASMGEIEPEGETEQELMAHQMKTLRTVVAVTDKAIPLAANEDEAVQGYYYRMQALRFLQDLGEPHADEKFQQSLEQALADERSGVVAIGMKFKVESGFGQWTGWSEAERSAWVDFIINHLKAQPPEPSQMQMISAILDFLDDMQGEQYASKVLDVAIPHFKQNENLAQVIPMLEGIQRRMNLPGNQMEIEGTLLDGSDFDWDSYRGSVVLVDFWATWCGPCRVEVPHIIKLYNAYHEKGFEVVGISLDEKREDAETYIQQTEIPWVTLFSEDDSERGWEHPLAVRYGITGIPRAILINREGIVVSMNARGAVLEQELRKLLGEPLARAGKSDSGVDQQVAKPVIVE
jgi:thiol-disulfide isomerase/thioredoxin